MANHAAKNSSVSKGQSAIEQPAAAAGRLRAQSAIESGCGPTARSLLGQAAMETLVLAGFALMFMLPLLLLFLSSSQSELANASLAQAKSAARTISDSAGELYLQGPGAKKTVLVNFPSGVQNASAEGGLVVLTLDSNGQRQDAVSATFANVSGNLAGPRLAGLQRISMEYNSTGNFVYIYYG